MSTGQVAISFYPPVDTGNAPPILNYTVTVQPGNIKVTGTGSPITVLGLSYGVPYTYSIVANNKEGASVPVTVGPIDISSVPDAPTNLVAAPGDGQATITFTAPDANGQPITGYTAISAPGGFTGTSTGSPVTVGGLTDGQTYTFTITATNNNGTGPASAPSNPVTPISSPTAPSAPTGVSAVAGVLSAVVSFTAPAANGSAITGYTVTSNIGSHVATGAASPITVLGLTAETAYTFTVTATNAIGTGPASAASNSVTPYTVPGAPTGVVGTLGNEFVSVAFTAPSDNGGSTITNYTVTSSGGQTASGASSPILVLGLTNGTAYTFTVTATNAAGIGPASAPSAPVVPATTPSAPLSVSASPGNAQIVVSFSPPASNGGSAVTGYTATANPGGFTASGAGSPLTITGLSNGTVYAVTVTAANAIGTGPPASAGSITPAPVAPSAPLSPSATGGNAQATVSFTVPASNGGLPIFNYTVTASPGGATGSNGQSPVTVTGLTNGVAYTFTVTAQNGAGTGPASVATSPVTPSTIPGAPTGVVATPGNAQASVAFVPPTSNGGSPITGYTVTSTQGGIQVSGGSSPILVTGLTNGNPYTFNVYATNANGNGPPSNSANPVTPATLPGAPQSPVATPGNASVSVAFSPPASNGGSAISSYTAVSSPGGFSASGSSSPLNVTGLTNGTPYTFTVTATNALGTGPASVATVAVTPTAPAGFVITTQTLPNGALTVVYNGTVVAAGSAFTPYTYANTTPLPPGLSLNASTGAITGTPTAAGFFTTGFQATDSSGTTTTPVATIIANNNGTGQAGQPGDVLTTTSTVSLTANGPVMFFGTVATYNAAHNARTLTASPTIPTITAEQVIEGPTSASNPNAINASQETDMWWCAGTPGGVTTFTNNWGTVGDSDFLAAWGVQLPVGTTLIGTNSAAQTGTQWGGVAQGSLLTSGYITVGANQVPCRLYGFCENTSGLGTNYIPAVGTITPQGGSALGPMTLQTNLWNFASSPPVNTTAFAYFDITVPGNYQATFVQNSTTPQCSQTFGFIVQGPASAGAVTPVKTLSITIAGSGVPSAPLSPSAVGGNAQATVSFSPPNSNGGSAITSYTVTSNPGNISQSGASSPITVGGLTNGVSYTFTVTATNSVGQGPPSAATAAVTPATVPSGPQNVVATAGNTQATVTYTAPLSTGGNAITGYHATAVPGGQNTVVFSPTPVPITVTGLTNGTPYTIGVHAFNNIGAGTPDVQSNSVTPTGSTGGTPAAQALAYMKSIQGSKILVGQHTQYFEGNTNDETQAYTSVTPLYSLTGQLPAIIGVTANWYGTSDPYNNSGGGQPSLNVVSQIINDWVSTSNNSHKAQNAAGIVQINWGQLNPVGNSNNFVPISSSQLASTVTPGSSAYNNLANQTAELQAYLKSVVATNPNIVIILRLFAELNGNFLWYGVQNSQTDVNNQILMHQQVFNNLFNGTTLRNNVLVAYDANGYGSYGAFGPMSAWPGQGYADMAGIDVYNQTWSGSNGSIQAGTVTAMNALGVPLIFCECAVDNGASNPVSNPTFSVDNNLIPNWIRASGRNFVAYVQWNDNGNNANNGGTNLPGNIPGSMSICLQNNASFVMNAVDIVNLIELPSFT